MKSVWICSTMLKCIFWNNQDLMDGAEFGVPNLFLWDFLCPFSWVGFSLSFQFGYSNSRPHIQTNNDQRKIETVFFYISYHRINSFQMLPRNILLIRSSEVSHVPCVHWLSCCLNESSGETTTLTSAVLKGKIIVF